jgi:K+-transporting ATPase ATPase C chain
MSELRPALVAFGLLTLLTGVLYPHIVTGVGQAAFARQANGSLIQSGERMVGSRLLGQPFSSPEYFWSRPSATSPQPYNGALSSGSNLGPINPALESAVRERIAALRSADPYNDVSVPIDLVTASASGLDPHISPAAAGYQVARVARARNMSEDEARRLVSEATDGRTLGVWGEPRVNVLELNLALDALAREKGIADGG